jgi:hypothetical protein
LLLVFSIACHVCPSIGFLTLIFGLLAFTGGVSSQLRQQHAIGGGTLISTTDKLGAVDRRDG